MTGKNRTNPVTLSTPSGALASDMMGKRWNNRTLLRLMWPLVIEQLLAVSIGMADTVMVSVVGESAVSGVSLVDAINVLIITLFVALATGGAVVTSQYIGRDELDNASQAAQQLMYVVSAMALAVMAVVLLLQRPLLGMIYGGLPADVLANAQTYLWLSALSYPFIAVYNAGASIFRSMGNSKASMMVAFLVNVLNIGGNALLIFGFDMGVAGAAISTLVSRAVAAVIMVVLLMDHTARPIFLVRLFPFKTSFPMIRRILTIGVPNGLENSVFQIGKIMVARIVSSFGTSAIAANAITVSICSFAYLPGQAFGMAMLTVVGQCVGAGDFTSARRNTKKLMGAAWGIMALLCVCILLFRVPLLSMFNLTPAAIEIASHCLLAWCIISAVLWVSSFALPNALRAAGDARYTMVVSLISMWLFRIGTALLLSYTFGFGVLGVWLAMGTDFVFRSICFSQRWIRGVWRNKSVIR